MSTILSNENRALVHQAIRSNRNVLMYFGEHFLPPATTATVEEMVSVTVEPYNPDNVNFVGDTLDRHSWSCFGNLQEMVAMLTLLRNVGASSYDYTQFLRSIEDQVGTKVDIIVGFATYQVKTATYGSGGQLFVAESELEGTADQMAYVDAQSRRVITFVRGKFRKNMKDIMDVGGPYDRWYNQAGWFISPELCDFVRVTPIPAGVTTAYYNADEQQIYLKD